MPTPECLAAAKATLARLAEMRARCEAAPPGPWVVEVIPDKRKGPMFRLRNMQAGGLREAQEVAEHIVSAHDDLPACLSALETLRDALREAVTWHHRDCTCVPCHRAWTLGLKKEADHADA